MTLPKIPLTKPLIEDGDITAMEKTIRGHSIAQGHVTALFEKTFSESLGAIGGVATNSCTSALILALRALGIGPEDQVILPSYTCLAVLHAVRQVGAVPVLVDNECAPLRMDYNMTAQTIKPALTRKTKAIIVPHMFGVSAKIDEIVGLGIPVIEDITLSLGARYKNRAVGSWGALSVCSFHASKMITSGEGGMLTASDEKLYARVRYLNGWEAEQLAMRFSTDPGEKYELRYNFHLSDVAASLGLSQFSRLSKFLKKRQALASQYTSRLSGLDSLTLPSDATDSNLFFRYLLFVKNQNVVEILKAFYEKGIEAGRGVYPPLHRFGTARPADFPGAEKAMSGVLSIPLYPALRDEEIAYLLDTTADIFAKGTCP